MNVYAVALMVLITMTGCATMRNTGRTNSPYIGESFETTFGMVYIKNLPKAEDVPYSHIIYTPKVWVSDQLLGLLPDGALIADYITTPIRVEYVPPGTKFKAIDSYRIKYGGLTGMFFDIDFDLILLEDDKGNRSEVEDYFFKSKHWIDKGLFMHETYEIDKILPTILTSIKEKGFYDFICPNSNKSQVEKFIIDLRIENDMSVLKPASDTDTVVIKFKTSTAYLTFVYYGQSWHIKCLFEND